MPQEHKGLSTIEETILAAYGLEGTPAAVQSLVVWEERFIVSFDLGAARFFFKQWPSFVNRDWEYAFCLDLQDWARARCVPLAGVFTARDGERIFTWEDRRFSLYEFVGTGYDPGRGRVQILASAEALGELHTATAEAKIGGKRWRDDPFPLVCERISESQEELEKTPATDSDRERIRESLAEMAARPGPARLQGRGHQPGRIGPATRRSDARGQCPGRNIGGMLPGSAADHVEAGADQERQRGPFLAVQDPYIQTFSDQPLDRPIGNAPLNYLDQLGAIQLIKERGDIRLYHPVSFSP
jgi:hypothetical protein